MTLINRPPDLKPGDTIGITSPAGAPSQAEILPAVRVLESWGFKVKIGQTIGKSDGTFGGTDQERIDDFQAMLDDPNVSAILCARGGYGFVRIIDRINFEPLRAHPKWLIGFSDITVLHSHINRQFGLATLHAKMCSGFQEDASQMTQAQLDSMISIKTALTGQAVNYSIPVNPNNRSGSATGYVVGGNLRTLETLVGTNSDINVENRILFVEDVSEPLYSIDRMFWNLKRSGKLANLAGLLVGGFKIRPDDDNEVPFSMDIYQIVLEKVRQYHYPVCFDFPVGHQELNLAVKCGVQHQLIVNKDKVRFVEV